MFGKWVGIFFAGWWDIKVVNPNSVKIVFWSKTFPPYGHFENTGYYCTYSKSRRSGDYLPVFCVLVLKKAGELKKRSRHGVKIAVKK